MLPKEKNERSVLDLTKHLTKLNLRPHKVNCYWYFCTDNQWIGEVISVLATAPETMDFLLRRLLLTTLTSTLRY